MKINKLFNEVISKKQIRSKFKIKKSYIAIAIISFCLLFWASFFTINLIYNKTRPMLNAASTKLSTEIFEKDIQNLSDISPLSCWEHAITLIDIKPWLETSSAEILKNLKSACLKTNTSNCDGSNCESNNKTI